MGALCSGGPPKQEGTKDRKQGLCKEKNKLFMIEAGKEAFKESFELLNRIKVSV